MACSNKRMSNASIKLICRNYARKGKDLSSFKNKWLKKKVLDAKGFKLEKKYHYGKVIWEKKWENAHPVIP
jgi:hypothetical protein